MLNWSFLLCYSWQRLERTNPWLFFFRRRLWYRAPNLNRRRSLRLLIMRCQSPRQCNGINDPEGGVISRLCTDFIIDLCEINECSWDCMALHGCPHWTSLACRGGRKPRLELYSWFQKGYADYLLPCATKLQMASCTLYTLYWYI